MRKALIISPHFPPSTVAGVHRARHLAKHLPAAGWAPTILCVDEKYHCDRLDPELLGLLSTNIDVVKVPALSAKVMRCFGIGDIGIRAYPYLSHALSEVIESRNIEVVLITGSPFYPFLLSSKIKRKFGTPVVLDFQDPWVSHWGARRSPLTKAWAAHRIARAAEPAAVKDADFVTSVSQTQNEEFLDRHRWFGRDRVAAFPIGGDPDDFTYLRANPIQASEAPISNGNINLSYVGTLLPRATPILRVLFKAISQLCSSGNGWVGRLRLNFVGTSNQTNGHNSFRVLPIASEFGIGHLITEVPQRIPYIQALDLLANSEVVLLLGSDEPHYTASKIYPALMCGRPSLAIFHQASSAYDILNRSAGSMVFGFSTEAELLALASRVAHAVETLALSPSVVSSSGIAEDAWYSARSIAAGYAKVFEAVTEKAR